MSSFDYSPLYKTRHAYIVSYDLKAFSWNYTKLFEELKRSPIWWHYLNSTWIVVRDETLYELQDLLLPLIYKNDSLLIMPAKGPAAGILPVDAWEWIKNNVP